MKDDNIKKIVVVICAALLFSALAACRNAGRPAAGSETGQQASFVTYNVLADPDMAEQRIPELLKIIGDSDADIIAMQEVAPWFVRKLVKADWFKKYHAPKSGNKIIAPRGLLILSKKPIVSSDYGLLPSRQKRAYLIVETKVNGVDFKVATCHLDSFLKEGAMRARQLDIFFNKLSSHEDVIFMGDFNFGDDEQPETAHINNSYVDLWTQVNGKQKGYTWDIEKNAMAWMGSFPNEKSRRLDRILIKSKRAKPVSSKILGDKTVKAKTGTFPSDHFGLRATVSIK